MKWLKKLKCFLTGHDFIKEERELLNPLTMKSCIASMYVCEYCRELKPGESLFKIFYKDFDSQ